MSGHQEDSRNCSISVFSGQSKRTISGRPAMIYSWHRHCTCADSGKSRWSEPHIGWVSLPRIDGLPQIQDEELGSSTRRASHPSLHRETPTHSAEWLIQEPAVGWPQDTVFFPNETAVGSEMRHTLLVLKPTVNECYEKLQKKKRIVIT